MSATLYNARNEPMIPPAPPTGFYLCGQCPKCFAPLFYHGGGEAIKPPTTVGLAQPVLLPTIFLPTCDCNAWQEGQIPDSVAIPMHHNLWMEREAVIGLYTLYQDALARVRGMEIAYEEGGANALPGSEAQEREIQSEETH
jgi:hypothetical protein